MMDSKNKKFLLALARQTIVDYYETGQKIKLDEGKIPDQELSHKAATFVTLTEDGMLRGCIGSLLAKRKMYEDVINNALYAAFGDARFNPVSREEIPKIKIEISVLSGSKPYKHKNQTELLQKIKPKEHGVIVQKGYSQATYLPQVWDDLRDKKEFLSSLCQKAGLDKNAWQSQNCEIFYYTVEKFSE